MIAQLLREVVCLPVAALVFVPFLHFGARLIALRRLSFGATYMLALIVGGCLAVAGLVVISLLSLFSPMTRAVASIGVSLVLSGGIAGYLVTTEERKSIGFGKGALLISAASLLFAFAAAILAVAFAALTGVMS